MSAVDEILAAIVKLSEQKERATAGPWFAWHPGSERGNSSVDAPTHDPDDPLMVVEGGRKDVELIVTLHATIDAQLSILTRAGNLQVMGREKLPENVLILARAINGGTA